MDEITPYLDEVTALAALDNGGRFYNIFTEAGDDTVTTAELSKVAGVLGDKQRMVLFLEMSLMDLSKDQQQDIHKTFSPDLQSNYERHSPQHLSPAEVNEKGLPARSAIITGTPHFVEDKTVFNGFIMVPIMIGKTMSFTMVPIMQQLDIYELSGDGDSPKTFLSQARGVKRLRRKKQRFGGILKETAKDQKGENKDQIFLQATYFTSL